MAVCLDPRFKQTKFLDSHQRVDLQFCLTNLARQFKSSSMNTLNTDTSTVQKESDQPQALDILLGSDSPSSNERFDSVQDKVEEYFKQQQSPRETSSLEFWKINKCRFPVIACLARTTWQLQLHQPQQRECFLLQDL